MNLAEVICVFAVAFLSVLAGQWLCGVLGRESMVWVAGASALVMSAVYVFGSWLMHLFTNQA